MGHLIQKSTGEAEPFNIGKLAMSLERAGAAPDIAWKIAESVAREKMMTSKDIHKATLHASIRHDRKLAIRYNLKQALMDLGPSGYPFEKYMAALMRASGYKASNNQIIDGKCVRHEIDIYLEKPEENIVGIAECKFRNQPGSKIDVKVPLYFDSRFRDVIHTFDKQFGVGKRTYEGWLITNTKFTGDAIAYGKCAGLHLLGWTFPTENSIARLIERHGLIPVTALSSLTFRQKRQLLDRGIVMCTELSNHIDFLRDIGVGRATVMKIQEDIGSLCRHR
ncbi:ATPase [Candidatus Gracilibacteria bacterium CG17_big_fil_post_rev_8_21_14_2_50_48_13]|nr:MAG: ATPase [Candidatus Gracilibacteria bacterium CG17_big_fil_post_rev_8_21_14_2_50_48_13]